jgi:magnesium transporter
MHKRQALFGSLTPEVAADALEQMDTETQVDLIEGMGEEHATRVVGEMATDDAADLLSELEDEKAETSSTAWSRAPKRCGTADPRGGHRGRHHDHDFIALKTGYTVDQTIAVLRQEAREAENIYYLYVLDNLGHLVGVVTLRSLIVARPERRLADLMSTRVISVTTGEDKGVAAELFAKFRFRALPVVDDAGVMKGIITIDDVLEHVAPELNR